GGQHNGGTMTAQNPEAVVDCIQTALSNAGVAASEIDLISGHLTSTRGDPYEIKNWVDALNLSKEAFPFINTPKSMIGHCVAGAGSIETIACILQLSNDYIHENLNLDEIHPEITALVNQDKIPTHRVNKEMKTVIKSNFGFGDLNCCLVLRKFK
ncbi:MAG: beta-ketoacyl-[acyl-carrier-protein] synthase family protein, partial [Marinoscillum sp.]